MLSKDGEIERTVLTPGQLPGMEQPLSLQMFFSPELRNSPGNLTASLSQSLPCEYHRVL